MIAWLKGKIIDIDGGELIIDTNGVGYRVQVGNNLIQQVAPEIGKELELAVYTSVKEDGIRLFGFNSFFVRRVFILLLSVNGIGPKVALNIVDQLGAGEIVRGLKMGDDSLFTRVSGVGKKTAQRMILDLQGKPELLQFDKHESESSEAEAERNANQPREQLFSDAVSALANLGFSVKEAEKTMHRHITAEISFDDLIRRCLADLKKMA